MRQYEASIQLQYVAKPIAASIFTAHPHVMKVGMQLTHEHKHTPYSLFEQGTYMCFED